MGKGYLQFSDFKNFVQNNKFIKGIELSNSGEIFLNPDLIYILEYAFKNNIALYARNGVNFNTVSDEILQALVRFRFRNLTIAIDGASQEIYSLYRVKGNFDTVIANIKKINEYKEKYNSKFPELIWQYILMEHNENDIIKVKAMAKELKMNMRFQLAWDSEYIPKNREILMKETGLKYLTRKEKREKQKGGIYNRSMCHQLWKSPQINWDGRLLGCCGVYMDDFGVNVFEVGLKKAVNSDNYKYAKKMLTGKAGVPKNVKNIPCVNCDSYKMMKETGIYL
jgi:MoaA/NifB/PqqE/SkfB family radical SAM enzyme